MNGPVVILGCTGMLGQALMREAQSRGLQAVGLSRRQSAGVDLACIDSIGPLLAPLAPGLVINAAAMTSLEACEANPGAAYLINARLPALLARSAIERDMRWVHVSSDHFFCAAFNVLHDEFAPVTLVNEYARSKYAGEAFARSDPGALVLRTNIVGRRGWRGQPSFAEWALAALDKGEPFAAYSDVWASSIEVGQFAQALFDLVQCGARGLVNLAARESTSKAAFIRALALATGRDPDLARGGSRPADVLLPRATAMGLNVARAEAMMGRRLPDAAAVIAALAESFKTVREESVHAHP